MQFNDDVFAQFGDLGYTGTYNDRFFEFLGDQGYTGTLQDRMFKWFGDLGYTGGFADRWFQWAVGGFLVGEAPVISDLVVDEGAPSIDFTVTGADGTAYIVLSANAVETAEDIFAWADPDTLFTFPVTLGGISESLDFSAVPDGTYYIHVIVANGALLSNVLTDGPYLIESAPVRSKTYCGTLGTGGGGSETISGNLDIGTAEAGRLIVVGIMTQNNPQASNATVTVNGVSLSLVGADDGSGYYTAFYAALVTTGDGSQAVSVTFENAAFAAKYAHVWALRNLGSNTVVASGATNLAAGFTAITVAEDEYLLAIRLRGSTSEGLSNGPTQSPDRQASNIQGSWNGWSGDWEIAASSASFDMGLDSVTSATAYVRYL